MTSEIGVRSVDYGDEKDLSLWPHEQRRHESRDRDSGLDILRSGSAPPTVEGSLTAVGGLFSHHGDVWSAPNKCEISDDELRSDPDYINYYYSNVNMNPRLPPPFLSKEDWRSAHRLNGSSGGGSKRLVFSSHLGGFSGDKEENGADYVEGGQDEWSSDGLIGLGLGSAQKSIAEILQDDLNHKDSIARNSSRPNKFDDGVAASDSQFSQYEHEMSSNIQGFASKNAGSASVSYASALGSSLSRSATPDPQLIARASSPLIPPVGEGRANSMDKRIINGPTPLNGTSNSADIVAALSGMNLAVEGVVDEEKHLRFQYQHGIGDHQHTFHHHGDHGHHKQNLLLKAVDSRSFCQQSVSQSANANMGKNSGLGMDRNNYYVRANGLIDHLKHNGSSTPNYHTVGSPSSAIPNYSLSGHNINPALASMMASQLGNCNMPLLFDNATGSPIGGGRSGPDSRAMGGGRLGSGASLMAAAAELQNLGRGGNQPVMDPMYLQYLKSSEFAAAHLNDIGVEGGNSYMDLLALQKAYLAALLSPQKLDRGGPYLSKSGGYNSGYYGNQALGLGMAYGNNPLVGSLFPSSPVGSGSPLRHGERNMRFASGMRNFAGGGMGSWRSEAGAVMEQSFGSTLLDEFKSNKTKCFELSEIANHVVEFSADQYGSRFIQQKLETATAEEKNMVFHEIIPQALSLMTDVFGNYVIQKFFEHGTSAQIRELANKLTGNVLTLSLQMYGCRVIQKAIEVVDLDQQKKMVTELDGHVMRCVRDQNGNHVIQKCIECIPEDAIQFIVSTFYDQVVTLSTHPYGCRVVQRVLEHCHDPNTQQIVMDEIMLSVCMLAQDQYGNYVVQHVLEHGKPDERSAIIIKLTGKIVQMSQQKFASNVIEKCLTFGDLDQRRAMVNEMLGATEENEPLQVMMKDQFGNYVVQKVLETCDDEQLEVLLLRIKIHLNALKKYTYGKHIVARVEKLVAAGERRIGMQASYASSSLGG